MALRSKTKRRLFILGMVALLVVGAGAAVYLRYLQKRNAELAAWRSAAMSAYAAGDYAAALPHFSKYLTASKAADKPRGKADTEALFAYGKSRASVVADNRHLWEARGIFERYLALMPGDLEAEHMLLDLYPRLNMNAEAVIKADDVLARHPGDVVALKAKTKALIQRGLQQDAKAFPDAVAAGRQLIEAAPLDVEAHLLTIRAMAEAKRPPEEVIAHAQRLLGAHPEDPRFELVVAEAHLYAGRLADARRWLTSAAARKAPDVSFVNELVARLDALSQFRQSQDVLERAAAEFPDRPSLVRAAVQRQWQAGRYNAVLDRLKGLDPASAASDAALLGFRALTLLQHGNAEEGRPIVDALAARGDTDSAAFAWSTGLRAIFPEATGVTPPPPQSRPSGVGRGIEDAAGLKEAVQKLKSALEKDPGNAVLQFYLAGMYGVLGERTLSLDAMTQAARRSPSWAAPRSAIAKLLTDEGRYEEAVRSAHDAFTRDRSDLSTMVNWAQAAYGLLETMPDQKVLDWLVRTVEEIQQYAPGEPNTLPIHAAVLARSGRRDDAAEVIRAALDARPAPSPRVVARLAAVSRDHGLGLEDAAAEKLRGAVEKGGPAAAFAAAVERYRAGKGQDGLRLLTDARGKATDVTPAEELAWRMALAQYLDVTNDPSALAKWVELADGHPGNLFVQTAALRSPSRHLDREFWKRAIERVKKLTVENSQLWRLEEAKFLLTGELGEQEQASVLATLTELSRNAPHSAEPHRLLAIAHERSASTASTQGQGPPSALRAAAEEMTKASDLRPADVSILADLSRLLRTVGRGDDALRYLDRAAASPALERTDRLRLAELYAQHGRHRRAIEVASPLGMEAAPRVARWHRTLGQQQQAVDLYARLLEAPDVDAQTVLDAASFFAEQSQPEQAEKFLGRLDSIKELRPGARELVRAKFCERYRPAEATRWYAAAAAAQGAAAGVWRELAGHHLRHRRLAESAAAAQQGLAAHPNDPELQAMKARARELEPLAQDRSATPLLGYLSFDPRNAPANEMLRILLEAKSAGGADVATNVNRMRAAADRHPTFLPLQVAAVRGHLRAGDPQKAEVVARRAVASFPDDVEAIRLLAAVYSSVGRWPELRDAAMSWRRLTPQDPLEPDLLIARAALNTNDAAAAAERLAPYAKAEVEKAKTGGPANAEVLDLYARALIAAGKSDDAAAALEPLAKQSAAWRRLWLDLAGAFRSRDLEAAAKWVTRVEPSVARDAPDERRDLATAWYVVGREFNDRESLSTARTIAQPLTGAGDAAAEAWMIMASCDEALGNLDAAEKEYREALKLRPNQPAAQNNLAYVLLLKGGTAELAEAHQLSTAAVSAMPNTASFHDTLARIEARRGNLDVAVTGFRKALSLEPGNLEAMIGLTDTLSKNGRRDDARAQLAQIDSALETSPRLPPQLQKQLDSVRTSLRRQSESGRAE